MVVHLGQTLHLRIEIWSLSLKWKIFPEGKFSHGFSSKKATIIFGSFGFCLVLIRVSRYSRLLHQAALWDNAELLEDLLHGEELGCLDARDSWGRTALHAAATNLDSQCLRILCQVCKQIDFRASLLLKFPCVSDLAFLDQSFANLLPNMH